MFIRGRVSAEEGKDAKLIASEVISLDDLPKTVWIQFEKMSDYDEEKLFKLLDGQEGDDSIAIYIRETKQVKHLPSKWNITYDEDAEALLTEIYGKENVKVVEGSL